MLKQIFLKLHRENRFQRKKKGQLQVRICNWAEDDFISRNF